MSEFTTEFDLFESVVAADYSSPNNMLSLNSHASTWHPVGNANFNKPLTPFPGGTPLIPSVTVNELEIEIVWRRFGNVDSFGTVRGHLSIAPGAEVQYFQSTIPVQDAVQTDIRGGDLAYWGLTQQQMHDFCNGDIDLDLRWQNISVNASTQKLVSYVRAKMQYTYTGSGIAFPTRF